MHVVGNISISDPKVEIASLKHCYFCHQDKALVEFQRRTDLPGGFSDVCLACKGSNKKHKLVTYKNKARRSIDGACKLCGSEDVLEAHHIIPVAIGGYTTSGNSMTLCSECHHKISKYYIYIGIMGHCVEWHERRACRVAMAAPSAIASKV
jgi:hypothetical protein